MTIKKFLDKARKLDGRLKNADGVLYSEAIQNATSIWDNDACKGYTLRAAHNIGLSVDKAAELLAELHFLFDEISVEDAAEIYRRS